jgi:hypothetical protein
MSGGAEEFSRHPLKGSFYEKCSFTADFAGFWRELHHE